LRILTFSPPCHSRARAGGAGTGSGVGGVANEEREQTLNQLLTEMDGFEGGVSSDKPVIVLAATNRPDALDAALRRPGRFDRTVGVAAPDRAGRAAILAVHLGKLKPGALAPGVDAAAVAAITVGMTGAELANVVNEAALLAARRRSARIENVDVALAAERAAAGLERRSLVVSPAERRVVALHECGHAIVGRLAGASDAGGSQVSKISVIPRAGGALGVTLRAPQEDRYLASEGALRGVLATLMGGRAAERVALGALTNGASDDIRYAFALRFTAVCGLRFTAVVSAFRLISRSFRAHFARNLLPPHRRATAVATDMVASYGMCPTLGPRALMSSGNGAAAAMLGNAPPAGEPSPPSPALAARLDEAIDGLLRAADGWAVAAVDLNLSLLNEMADALLAAETLSGAPLEAFLRRVAPPAGFEGWVATGAGAPPAAAVMAARGKGR
jgi:cell division protease FtsH